MNDEFRSAIVAARYEEAWKIAYSAGAEHAAQIVRGNSYHGHAGLFACSTDLPCKTCKLVEQILAEESIGAPQEQP